MRPTEGKREQWERAFRKVYAVNFPPYFLLFVSPDSPVFHKLSAVSPCTPEPDLEALAHTGRPRFVGPEAYTI